MEYRVIKNVVDKFVEGGYTRDEGDSIENISIPDDYLFNDLEDAMNYINNYLEIYLHESNIYVHEIQIYPLSKLGRNPLMLRVMLDEYEDDLMLFYITFNNHGELVQELRECMIQLELNRELNVPTKKEQHDKELHDRLMNQ